MQALKDRIINDGVAIGTEIVKVDSFLNHQLDVGFLYEIGAEFRRRFSDVAPTKILTTEASGISVACMAAMHFERIPVIFAKKTKPSTMIDGFYSAEVRSFTKNVVSQVTIAKKYLSPDDRILMIDDFLAHGEAGLGLLQMVRESGAYPLGLGAVIEKAFQGGAARIRAAGCRVESLAVIEKIDDGVITFA